MRLAVILRPQSVLGLDQSILSVLRSSMYLAAIVFIVYVACDVQIRAYMKVSLVTKPSSEKRLGECNA